MAALRAALFQALFVAIDLRPVPPQSRHLDLVVWVATQ